MNDTRNDIRSVQGKIYQGTDKEDDRERCRMSNILENVFHLFATSTKLSSNLPYTVLNEQLTIVPRNVADCFLRRVVNVTLIPLLEYGILIFEFGKVPRKQEMCLVISKIVLQNNWRISRKTSQIANCSSFSKSPILRLVIILFFYFKEFYFSFRIYVINKNFITLLPDQKMYSDIFRNANRLDRN